VARYRSIQRIDFLQLGINTIMAEDNPSGNGDSNGPEGQEDVGELVASSIGTKTWILAIVILLVAVVAVVLGVVLSHDNGGNDKDAVTTRPTPPPFPSPSAVTDFMNGLPAYSIDLAGNNTSPQAKAFTWLQDDPLYNEYEVYRLNQRYVLAVLYYSTRGESWENGDGWLTDRNECSWHTKSLDDICTTEFRLSILSLWLNGLNGSIPTEVELLTDLESINFWDDLSFTIPPEMYVCSILLCRPFVGCPSVYLTCHTLVCSGNLSNLDYLQLSGPMIAGTIPTEM
jgi:hypothetical protein